MTVCPTCQHDSAVEPVSDVYAESISSARGDDLGWLFAPPSVEPRLPPHSYQDREENRVLLPAVVLSVVLGVVVAVVGYGFGGFLVTTLPGALVALIVAKGYASARYQSARAAAIAAAKAQEKLPVHQQLLERWEAALYCRRDDSVFFPVGDTPLTPTEFRNLMSG